MQAANAAPDAIDSRLVTVAKAAEILALSERTLWRLVAAGDIEAIRIGRATRVSLASIEALIVRGGSR